MIRMLPFDEIKRARTFSKFPEEYTTWKRLTWLKLSIAAIFKAHRFLACNIPQSWVDLNVWTINEINRRISLDPMLLRKERMCSRLVLIEVKVCGGKLWNDWILVPHETIQYQVTYTLLRLIDSTTEVGRPTG